jgi:rhodanese-related sulfurtransferase
MPVTRVTPAEAHELCRAGWAYVDVRSVPEYEAGHPPSAYNIPLMHFAPGRGMAPNAEFAAVFARHFGKDTPVVMGCKTGGRSLRAAEMLAELGYARIVDMRGGFAGEADMTGRVMQPGWQESGLPVEQVAQPGRTYEQLK